MAMKVLFVSSVDIDAQEGSSVHFLELVTQLAAAGHTLAVLCPGTSKSRRDPKFRYVPFLNVRYLRSISSDLVLSLYMIRSLMTLKPDVVYYRGVTIAGILARVFRTPSVAEASGIYADEAKMEHPKFFALVGPLLRLRERTTYKGATRVVCVSAGIQRRLAEGFDVKEVICSVIPNGVNATLFRPMDTGTCRNRVGLTPGDFYVGFVGTFKSWQELDTLINAIGMTKEKGYENIRCLLVGHGDLEEQLKEMVAARNLENHVSFVGRIAYDNVPIYINSVDICYVSKVGLTFESLPLFSPLKLYEYLACGRPVIVSRVQGLTEPINAAQCGFSFEPGSVHDLASTIIKSYEERAMLQKMGANGRTIVVHDFSWEAIARRVQEVMKDAVASRH